MSSYRKDKNKWTSQDCEWLNYLQSRKNIEKLKVVKWKNTEIGMDNIDTDGKWWNSKIQVEHLEDAQKKRSFN